MKAGIELDALVAKVVFGCNIISKNDDASKEDWNIENVWTAPHAICLAALEAVK